MDTKERDQILESLFKDNPGSEVPQEVETRLRRHLITLRERMEEPKGKERSARVHGWGLTIRYMMPAVSLIMICLIIYMVMTGGGASKAYANAVKKLRNAHSMTYTLKELLEKTWNDDLTLDTENEYVFKEPHYMRVTGSNGYYVANMAEKKSLTVLTSQKQYFEMDLSDTSSDNHNVPQIIYELRSLPERADEVLEEQEMDGHIVQGFRVSEKGMDKTLWVDVETGDLVRMEGEFVNAQGMHIVIENIQFDIEYDDTFFSLDPPPGFTPKIPKLVMDTSLPNEQDLINLLDFLTSYHVDGLFPDSLSKTKVLELVESGKFGEPDITGMTYEESYQFVMESSHKLERGFRFIIPLEPQNWHYAGQNVKRGAVDTPVFWYKPNGSKTYRVIYADLTVRDVAPEDLPPVPPLPAVQKN